MSGGSTMNTPSADKAEFLFDIGSPNAYLCHKLLPAIEARTGQRVTYVPILLGGLLKLANETARPPCGWGTKICAIRSAYCSKNPGLFFR